MKLFRIFALATLGAVASPALAQARPAVDEESS